MDADAQQNEEPAEPDELVVDVDGTRYPFPANFTFWEARWVKEMTRLAMGDFIRAGLREDPDTTFAYAAVAMLRSPSLSLSPDQIQRILDEKPLGSVRVVEPKDGDGDPPADAGDDAGPREPESPTPPASPSSTTETLEPSGAPV